MKRALEKSGFGKPTEIVGETHQKSTKKDRDRQALLKKMTFIKKEEAERLVDEYLKGKIQYYLDEEKKETNEKFFDEYPRALAYVLVEKDNKLSQLRKFYYVIERISRSINLGMDVKQFKGELKALVGHAWNKYDSNYVSKEFHDMLEKNVEAIKDSKDFQMFKQHFEAILCYVPKMKED